MCVLEVGGLVDTQVINTEGRAIRPSEGVLTESVSTEPVYIFERLRQHLLRAFPEQPTPAATFEEALDRGRCEWQSEGGGFQISEIPGNCIVYCMRGIESYSRGEARTRDEAEALALLDVYEKEGTKCTPHGVQG